MRTLSAAFAKVSITPEEHAPLQGYDPSLHIADPVTDIMDPLFAKICLLDDGVTRIAVVCVDSCLTNEQLVKVCHPDATIGEYREFMATFPNGTRQRWAHAAGTKEPFISVHATHTHSAPAHFSEKYTARVEAEIKRLVQHLVPVNLYVSSGESLISANRRPDLKPNFDIPIDQTLQLLWFETLQGEPLGSMMNYAVHPTCLKNPANRVSSEFVGLAMSRLEANTGEHFVAMFLQGFSGDVCPLYGGVMAKGDTYPQVVEGGEQLYQDMVKTLQYKSRIQAVPLHSSSKVIQLPTREWFYKPTLTLTFIAMRMGDIAILSVSAEVFNGFINKIKPQSPFSMTLFSGVANGYSGYIPTRDAFADGLGGYEMSTTPFTREAESIFVDEAANLLRELAKSHE